MNASFMCHVTCLIIENFQLWDFLMYDAQLKIDFFPWLINATTRPLGYRSCPPLLFSQYVSEYDAPSLLSKLKTDITPMKTGIFDKDCGHFRAVWDRDGNLKKTFHLIINKNTRHRQISLNSHTKQTIFSPISFTYLIDLTGANETWLVGMQIRITVCYLAFFSIHMFSMFRHMYRNMCVTK